MIEFLKFMQIGTIWYFIISTICFAVIEEAAPNRRFKYKAMLAFSWPLILINQLIKVRKHD